MPGEGRVWDRFWSANTFLGVLRAPGVATDGGGRPNADASDCRRHRDERWNLEGREKIRNIATGKTS